MLGNFIILCQILRPKAENDGRKIGEKKILQSCPDGKTLWMKYKADTSMPLTPAEPIK